nr:SufD family Fe-S cluster assembly protein [Bacteroides sp.]
MSALDQYVKLYEANSGLFDANSAPALNARRPEALKALEGAMLPTRRTEGYERTSLEDLYAPDFGLNPGRVDIPVDLAATFKCAVPHMSTLLGVTVNDMFHTTGNLDERLPEGVTFMSLRRAAQDHPEIIEKYYGKLAPLTEPSTALNTLLAQDGVLIHLAPGARTQRPLQLVNIFSSPVDLMAPRRVLIVAEENSSLELLVCDHTNDADHSYLASEVVEIHAGAGSRINMCTIEESSAKTSRHSSLYARQADGSQLEITGVTLTCGTTRNDYTIDIEGHHCTTRLSGMAIGGGKMHIDNNTSVNHRAAHCKSDQLFKYTLDDESTGSFEGSILVTGEAPFTEAYQSNRNILAAEGARMHSKPRLEIYNDEVKCSHGATTGQLDSKALFYMQTRGIPMAEARTLLMQAFMSDVIDRVGIEGLRERLRHLVERRFARKDPSESCGDCASVSPLTL